MTKKETDILLALDRTSVIIALLDDTLGFYDVDFPEDLEDVYPGIRSERALSCLAKASEALCDLYQALGEGWYNEGDKNEQS